MVEWPFEDGLRKSASWLAVSHRAGARFPRRLCTLNQCPIHGTISPTARIHGLGKQGVEMGVTLLTFTPSGSLANFLLPVSMTLFLAGLEVLVPKGKMLFLGDTTKIPWNWKLKMSPGHFGHLSLNQQDGS